MDGLATSSADDYSDSTAQLAEELSDPALTEVVRSELIDRYFNETLTNAPSDFNIYDLQPILEDELGQYGIDPAEISSRLEAVERRRFIGATKETGRELIEHQADPVMLFTGQYTHRVEDIRIKGGGLDFVFERVYKNQTFYDGPFGHSWDHNFNLWIREESQTIIVRSSGELREDRYTLHPIHDYFQPPDGYHDVIVRDGQSFRLLLADGTSFQYERIPATPLHRLARVEDRNQNYLALAYNTEGMLRRVEINSVHRFVVFTYDSLQRITRITDHASRSWLYEYDDFKDLVRIWLPAASKNSQRTCTEYEYSSALYSGRLQHNLLVVRTSDTGIVVENEYGAVEGLLNFNRVIRQSQGYGETLFEYENILAPADWRYKEEERPTYLTRVCSPNGHVSEHLYNRFGNLIAKEEQSKGSYGPQRIVSRYRYNADGALVGSLSPEGSIVQYWYGRDDFVLVHNVDQDTLRDHPALTADARLRFGQLLSIIKRGRRYDFATLTQNGSYYGDFFPPPLAEDPAGHDIVVRYTYEPLYGRTLTISDPRVTTNADPRDPEVLNPAHPNYATYNAHLTRYTYGGPQAHLQRIDYPDCTRPDGSTLSASDLYTDYDPRGRLLRTVNAAGEVIRYEYYDAAARASEGLLKSEIRDPGGLNLKTEYEYTAIGAIKAKINPRGHRTEFEIDALGRVYLETNALGYKTKYFYDSDGRTVREERDATDGYGRPLEGGPEVRLFCFDPVGNLLQESVGGWDQASHLVTRHRYDGAGNRVMTVLPNSNRVQYAYEARDLLIRAVRAPCTPLQSTSSTFYNGDQRKINQVDGRGFRTHFKYDALGRMISETDALGNVRRWTYDKAGNVTVERFFERRRDGTYYLLSRRSSTYDERGREIRKTVNAFDTPLPVTDLVNDYLADPGPGIRVSTEYYLDGLGRIEAETDPRGNLTTYAFDPAGRRERTTDAIGNFVIYRYDADDNLEEEEEHSIEFDNITGAVVSERVYLTKHRHDTLGRRTMTIDPLGNKTEWEYDSRNNVTLERDALDNVVRYVYDVYGRRRQTRAELTSTGLRGSPAAIAVTLENYDANGSRIRITDPVNNVTRYRYDLLGRMTRIEYPDGTWQGSEYDQADNLTVYRDSRGVRVRHHYDHLNRRERSEIDLSRLTPGSAVAGTLVETFTYDGLGRVTSSINDTCRVVSTYDSLGRMLTESFHFMDPVGHGLGMLPVTRHYDLASNRDELTYPDGRKIRYHYDQLNRLIGIENLVKGAEYPGSAMSNDYPILKHVFQGLLMIQTLYGNGASISLMWDRARRITEMTHRVAGTNLLQLQQLADGVGNVRLHYELSPSASSGFHQYYDSLSRLVHIERVVPTPFNPNIFDALTVPDGTHLVTQADIDTMIGSLALPSGNRSFSFDLAGNREETRGIDAAAVAQSYSVGAGNRYDSVNGVDAHYDGLGCLGQRDQTLYTYDHRARLIRVVDETGEMVRYAYDANGRKVAVFRLGSVEHIVYDGNNALAIYLEGVLQAQLVNENAPDSHRQLVEGMKEYWFHKDFVGTTKLLSDEMGRPAAMYSLDPHGIVLAPLPVNPVYVPLLMGRPYDRAVALYDFRSRTYDPVWGRFLQRDPKGTVDSPNLYSAFANNPHSYLDPLGTESVRQWMFAKITQNIKEGNTWTAGAQYVGYSIWNSLTFGFVEKNSDTYEQYNGSDYVLMTVADTGRSAAIMGVSVATGGVGGRVVTAVGQTGASAPVAYAVGGAVGGSVSSAAALGTEDLIDVLGTGYRERPHSVREYGTSVLIGAGTGAATGALQGASLERMSTEALGKSGEIQASKITGEPRNIRKGYNARRDYLEVPGQKTPKTGKPVRYYPDQPANYDPVRGTQGTITNRGTVVEVKNYVKTTLSPTTENMPKAMATSQQRGVPVENFTSQNTRVTASYRAAVRNGEIIWRPELNPQQGGAIGGMVGVAAAGRIKPNR